MEGSGNLPPPLHTHNARTTLQTDYTALIFRIVYPRSVTLLHILAKAFAVLPHVTFTTAHFRFDSTFFQTPPTCFHTNRGAADDGGGFTSAAFG